MSLSSSIGEISQTLPAEMRSPPPMFGAPANGAPARISVLVPSLSKSPTARPSPRLSPPDLAQITGPLAVRRSSVEAGREPVP